jgi:chemotaxis protein methyltransferase CheR
MPGMKGDEFLSIIHTECPNTLNIMLTAHSDTEAVGHAVNNANLYRFIQKPWDETDLILTAKEGIRRYNQDRKLEEQASHLRELYAKAQEEISERKNTESRLLMALKEIKALQKTLAKENVYLREEIQNDHNFKEIIGESNELKYVLYRIEQIAQNDTTVLIQGETGTGKELVARAVHESSARNARPMIKVNCAALSPELIESELFGHEKGAFTGAISKKIGRFEIAHNGTLFLDEISELSMGLQSKLLRAIEYGEIERVGSSKSIKLDVRILTATNRDLEAEVEAGKFRKDLFYRINVYPISIPPLRKRKDDIPILIDHFIRLYNKRLGKAIERIPQSVVEALVDYDWPGNVRELQNIIERSMLLSKTKTLRLETPTSKVNISNALKPFAEVEKEYFRRVLNASNGKISGKGGAAEISDMHPNTLRSRMSKLGLK